MPDQDPYADICYQQNFLKEVIARVDLVGPIPQLKEEIPKAVAQTALHHFPIDEPRPAFTQEIHIEQGEMKSRREEFTQWNFFGRNREKRLTLTPEALFITYSKYDRYESLRAEFLEVTTALFNGFPEAQPSRLGLRYINFLETPGDDPLDWSEFINDVLLGTLQYKVEGGEVTRILNNIEMTFEFFNVKFQFGVYNPDYPAPVRRRFFALDFDAYFKGLIDPADIPERLDSFHTQIQALFEDTITTQTRELLNGNT